MPKRSGNDGIPPNNSAKKHKPEHHKPHYSVKKNRQALELLQAAARYTERSSSADIIMAWYRCTSSSPLFAHYKINRGHQQHMTNELEDGCFVCPITRSTLHTSDDNITFPRPVFLPAQNRELTITKGCLFDPLALSEYFRKSCDFRCPVTKNDVTPSRIFIICHAAYGSYCCNKSRSLQSLYEKRHEIRKQRLIDAECAELFSDNIQEFANTTVINQAAFRWNEMDFEPEMPLQAANMKILPPSWESLKNCLRKLAKNIALLATLDSNKACICCKEIEQSWKITVIRWGEIRNTTDQNEQETKERDLRDLESLSSLMLEQVALLIRVLKTPTVIDRLKEGGWKTELLHPNLQTSRRTTITRMTREELNTRERLTARTDRHDE